MAKSKPIKKCCHCKSTFPATSEFFSKARDRKDGLYDQCKQCVKRWNDTHREQKAAAFHRWYLAHRAEKIAAHKKWKAAHPEMIRISERRWREAHHDHWLSRHRARKAVWMALESGRLIRPKVCSSCQRRRKLNGHHFRGYAPRYWLTVRWLCIECHAKQHRKYPDLPPISGK